MGTTSSGQSTDPDPVPTPTTKVPSTPVLPSVDCTLRNIQRAEEAPQQIPLRNDEDSTDPILQDANGLTTNQVQPTFKKLDGTTPGGMRTSRSKTNGWFLTLYTPA